MNGIWFDSKHSYDDFNLVLSSVKIPPATAKTNYLDIPGKDGSLDLTEAIGEVRYNDRKCSFVFTAFPQDDFEVKKREISNYLNGKRLKIIVDKDPGYYWDGRCSVDDYSSNKNVRQITVGATVAPYKLHHNPTSLSFDLTTESREIVLTNDRMAVCPEITVTAETTLTFGATNYTLSAGSWKLVGIQLQEGENKFTAHTISGTGSITFTYQEGSL
jgi:hypothetical protein